MGKKSVELITVRRRDLWRQPAWAGAPAGTVEQRYPSKRSLRTTLAFAIDLIVHGGLGFLLAYQVLHRTSPDLFTLILLSVLVFAGFSIVDRIFVQWLCQATVGKFVTALRVVREDTGGRGTLWHFTRDWLLGVFGIFALLLQ
ncbi:RDD family protein [Actinocrispum wychmicini]|uniref:RDD family protein n=1 Tax=Actinocrispum wychmicini TaxID=1213861 RepID=A0A4R2J786_9PSEU|nr:RDD family protein [Actinocrispum wychmicini]TCO54931.1 RDD family protein [Actinocrispum wychmicini]